MINTGKYKGHTPAPWTIELGNMEEYGETDTVMSSEGEVAMNVMRQDVALLADAPLFLEEIERLRSDIKMAIGLLSHPEDIETTKKVQQALLWTLRGGQK